MKFTAHEQGSNDKNFKYLGVESVEHQHCKGIIKTALTKLNIMGKLGQRSEELCKSYDTVSMHSLSTHPKKIFFGSEHPCWWQSKFIHMSNRKRLTVIQ
jgi:hypothetical protein